MSGGRAARRLGPAALALLAAPLLLTACIPPPPLAVRGTAVRGPGSFAIVDDAALDPAARNALATQLELRGLRQVADEARPDWLVSVAIADRPLSSGGFVGADKPSDGPVWTDRPRKGGLLSQGRREIRLSIRFLDREGKAHEMLTAVRVVGLRAPPPDGGALVDAAFAQAR